MHMSVSIHVCGVYVHTWRDRRGCVCMYVDKSVVGWVCVPWHFVHLILYLHVKTDTCTCTVLHVHFYNYIMHVCK